jgi:hypothetical protein
MLLDVVKSNRKNKRFMAIFSNGKKIHFGLKGGSTYIDHHDVLKRLNYLKRHEVNENWDDPYTAGALSSYLLWGNNTTLKDNIKEFNKVFF